MRVKRVETRLAQCKQLARRKEPRGREKSEISCSSRQLPVLKPEEKGVRGGGGKGSRSGKREKRVLEEEVGERISLAQIRWKFQTKGTTPGQDNTKKAMIAQKFHD